MYSSVVDAASFCESMLASKLATGTEEGKEVIHHKSAQKWADPNSYFFVVFGF